VPTLQLVQLVEAEASAKLPAAQATHTSDVVFWPDVSLEEAAARPAGQDTQTVAPVVAWYWAPGQALQAAAPVAGW
jgi:hypothetical protein